MIIGFTGNHGVGKTTAASVFNKIESVGLLYKFTFANSLCAAQLIFEDECKSPRRKYPGYFVHRMEANLKMVNEGDLAIIDDVQNDDEALCIKNNGGVIIEITKEGLSPSITPSIVDFTVVNSGTIDELHSKILDLFA
jgi:hypothetical protein